MGKRMFADRRKLVLALSALWILVSMPVSEVLYDLLDGSGPFMRIFALAIAATPVWLFFGMKWLSSGAPVSRTHVVIALGAGLLLAVWAADSWEWNDVAYFPIVASLVFTLLAAAEQWRTPTAKKMASPPAVFDADKLVKLKQMGDKAAPLLRLTETVANEIHQHLKAIGGASPLPGIIKPEADATKAAYGLVHAAYMSCITPKQGSAVAMVLAIYQSHMVSNLTSLMMPQISGLPPLTPQDLQNERFRDPVRKLMKLEEENGALVHQNLTQNTPSPFLPLYQNLRPYISATATPQQMSAAFEDKFTALYRSAKAQVLRVALEV